MFICPKCKSILISFKCEACKYQIQQINSIYQFCDAPPLKLDGTNKYIGYDKIGENFEPATIYWDSNNIERYGVYEACGDLIAQTFGTSITVLDLGAGLGTASIPLAKNGIHTIAIDISNIMLSTAVKRAKGQYGNLTFAKMNAYELMLEDHSIDIVIENATLHLVDNPEAVLREIKRVLKPTGRLIRYSSYSQPLSDTERTLNLYCNNALSDISSVFYRKLEAFGYQSIFFNNNLNELINNFFEKPYSEICEGFSEVFTDKLKFRLHRLKTGAHSDLQTTPKEWITEAWTAADKFATDKYGKDYINIQGCSRYGACINIYKLR